MHDVRFFERNVMGARPQPQSPWILFFDGATRDGGSNNHPAAGIGAVLKNSRGHTVVELKKLIGPGVSSGVAKYKALIAGLKKALSLGVEFLLVKGDSRLVHSQVVGQCSVQDERLVEYQRKVMTLSKDFRALFMERISRQDNLRADRLANDAIDEELHVHVVDSMSEFRDQDWTAHAENLPYKRASQKHSTLPSHSHAHAHPPLKVKTVASVSPHVVKRPGTDSSPAKAAPAATATKSDDPGALRRRSRLFCPDVDDSGSSQAEQMSSPVRNHVQAAAKSMRSTRRLLSSSPSRRPEISHWDNNRLDSSPLSEESTSTFEEQDSCNNKLQQQQHQHGEANSATGSGTLTSTEQAGHDDARFDSFCTSSEEESSSDAEFSEQDYARLVKTLLKGFLHRKKSTDHVR